MTRAQAVCAIETGIRMAEELAEKGYEILATGETVSYTHLGGWCDSGTGCERMEDSFCINYILLELDRETMNR